MEKLFIKDFTIDDLSQIKGSLSSEFDNFWNYNVLKNELQNNSSINICIKNESEIIGFAGISIVLDIAELNNIVIKKDKRGNGFSSLLLEYLINLAKSRGCKYFNLEVSSKNLIAIHLYEKFGFMQVGKRPNYYNNADALLYTLFLSL